MMSLITRFVCLGLLLILGACQEDSKLITIDGLSELAVDYCETDEESQTYIINDQTSYEDLIQEWNRNSSCEDANSYPEINFEERTLLGQFTKVNNSCRVNYFREVYIDPDTKTYLYEVSLRKSGQCEDTIINLNLITIAKILNDYDVLFKVEEF